MSSNNNEIKNVYYLYLLIEILVFILNTILWIKGNLSIDYHIHFSVYLIVIPAFFYTLYFVKPSFKIAKFIHDLIHPLWSTKANKRKTYVIFAIVFVIPIIYFLLHLFNNIEYSIPTHISHWGIWITTIGVFLTARIYMELKDKSKHDYDEFFAVLIDFMNESVEKNKILLILPTLFIGGVNYKHQNIILIDKLKELAERDTVDLKIAIFDYDINQIKKLNEICSIKDSLANYSDIELNKYSFTLKDIENKSLLIKFHRIWNKFGDKNTQAEKDFYKNLTDFIKEIDKINRNPSNLFTVDKIKGNYFCKYKGVQPAEGHKDIFLFANVTEKMFYLGNVTINGQENVIFENTIIKDIGIGNEFNAIYNEFVSSRK
ncbi:MAG: hypothetical protein K8R41_00575 [Bacteroidales bacterium]|nr:hypothetical protein [Bacteroidales bacterium]